MGGNREAEMAEKPVIGFVGVGLMGWGMAKNAVEKGYPLRVMAHRKREAVEDLVGRGAVEVTDLDAMAAEADAIVLCVTGSPEVEATLAALVPVARNGLTVIDCSTSDPQVTERLAAELAGKGITLIDAPLSRTPAHALKLINNLVSLGYAAIWSECFGMVRKIGVEPGVFHEVLSNSGMNCGNFQNFAKYPVEGDPNGHKFTIANAFKDLGYYSRLATRHQAATLMSDGALQTLKFGMAMGMGERFIPEMADIVLGLNEPKRQAGE